jgi:hypothetical protein
VRAGAENRSSRLGKKPILPAVLKRPFLFLLLVWLLALLLPREALASFTNHFAAWPSCTAQMATSPLPETGWPEASIFLDLRELGLESRNGLFCNNQPVGNFDPIGESGIVIGDWYFGTLDGPFRRAEPIDFDNGNLLFGAKYADQKVRLLKSDPRGFLRGLFTGKGNSPAEKVAADTRNSYLETINTIATLASMVDDFSGAGPGMPGPAFATASGPVESVPVKLSDIHLPVFFNEGSDQNPTSQQPTSHDAGTDTGAADEAESEVSDAPETTSAQKYINSLPTKLTPANTEADLFEIKHTGPLNYLLEGGGEKLWVDGFDDTTILESKYIYDIDSSPSIPGSRVPPFLRAKINSGVSGEIMRAGAIINDPSNPFTNLRIITNDPVANPFFQSLLDQYNIPGQIVNP